MKNVSTLITATHSDKHLGGTKVIGSLIRGGRVTIDFKDSPTIDILIERISIKWKCDIPFYIQDWRNVPFACKLPKYK